MTDQKNWERSLLCYRERPFGSDVADAIGNLMRRNGDELPFAITKEQIIDELVEMASIEDDDDGNTRVRPHTVAAAKALQKSYAVHITESATFSLGYKRYERDSKHPVVPVSAFFFRHIYGDGSVRDVLDAMTETEAKQSLPRRYEKARDDNGEERIVYNDIAGIVIFPVNSRSHLIAMWLRRMASTTQGLVEGTVGRIERARPQTNAIAELKEMVRPLRTEMHRALPKPKREEE